MIRFFLLALLVFFFINSSFSQQSKQYIEDSSDLANTKTLRLTIDKYGTYKGEKVLPFKSVKVRDVRFDTTHIGLYARFANVILPIMYNNKIDIQDGISNSFSSYFNNFFSKQLGSLNELVFFIKRLRVTKRNTIAEDVPANKNIGQLSFQAEAFLKTDKGYYPAFKVDTILIETLGVKKNEITDEIKENLVMPLLQALQNKMTDTEWEKVITKKVFSENVVFDNYYKTRFNFPILLQPFKKGVYGSFSEFKNNAPSIEDFTIKKERFKSTSLVDKNGNYINTINIFGFSDGKNCWIQSGNYCYPLVSIGNSFEFFLTTPQNLKIALALEMDKGEVY